MKRKFNLAKTLTLVVLCLYALSMIVLLAWMAMTSLKPRRNWDNDLNYLGWPSTLTLDNYKTIFKQYYVSDPFRPGEKIGVVSQIFNSAQYALVGGFLTALSPLLVAYVCSRFNFKVNKILESTVLITMMLPIVGSTTSMVSMMYSLNMYNTFLSAYCMKFMFNTLYFFIYLGIFRSTSKEIYEAATIDGATELTLMIRIAFPLMINVFSTVWLIYFIQYWNDYELALVYLPSHPTLSYGIFVLSTDTSASKGVNYTTMKMACGMTLVVPTLILFIFLKEKLMTNLSVGGVKE